MTFNQDFGPKNMLGHFFLPTSKVIYDWVEKNICTFISKLHRIAQHFKDIFRANFQSFFVPFFRAGLPFIREQYPLFFKTETLVLVLPLISYIFCPAIYTTSMT